jgi:L-alanine-DL-glutamate epimerase-like enolase superfamily enzyme
MNSFPIEGLSAEVYTVPTDRPESDGTLEWKETTMVLVRIKGGGREGLGYTYGHAAIAHIIEPLLAQVIKGRDAMDPSAIQTTMIAKIRNNGQCGLAMMALSAVDIAVWDLKAKLLELPLCKLLGQEHEGMKIYGSGGFTSYTDREIKDQLSGWASQGISAVKIKVGRDDKADKHRVAIAREAMGDKIELYVDANGAYSAWQAITQAKYFTAFGANWLEEPVPAEFPDQLSFIRQSLAGRIRVVAGEYGYRLSDFRSLLETRAVDVLQADATRCGGITGFLKAGTLAETFRVPLSSHCAPSIHLHAALTLPSFSIGEYFHDHTLIEHLLFEGASLPRNGYLYPDLSRPGLGLSFKEQDAEKFRVA